MLYKGATDVDTITINVTPESEQSYKSSCKTDITYQQLNSNVNNCTGQRVTYNGTIIQVVVTSRKFIIDIEDHDIIYITINKNMNLIENDSVQFWGELQRYEFYTSTFSEWQIRMPKVEAKYIEKRATPGFELIIVIGAIALEFL